MSNQELPPVLLNQRRYASSIPSGRLSQYAPTQVPIVSKRGTLSKNGKALSIHDLTDPSMIDQKLKSLSHGDNDTRISLQLQKKQKANLKFLRYKFNPGTKQEEQEENVQRGQTEQYGQLGKGNRQKLSINIFYEHKNVLFQDDRAPLVYKQLFLKKEAME